MCCSRCYQMDDYSPAKNLMTMCFTYYYTGTVILSLSPVYIHAFHCQCLFRMLTDSALLSLTSTETMLSLCELVWQYCICFCKLEELIIAQLWCIFAQNYVVFYGSVFTHKEKAAECSFAKCWKEQKLHYKVYILYVCEQKAPLD